MDGQPLCTTTDYPKDETGLEQGAESKVMSVGEAKCQSNPMFAIYVHAVLDLVRPRAEFVFFPFRANLKTSFAVL